MVMLRYRKRRGKTIRKWKFCKKISQIYGDWIYDLFLPPTSYQAMPRAALLVYNVLSPLRQWTRSLFAST
ncbi:hypothetical protein KY285_010855 [Solanum tuberosum]|nr:hypothetical protein KY289_011427 [Solanum tuberosum]KAH0735148.1 hypothetical protein KY285_010855 [Solanum tuberosum]